MASRKRKAGPSVEERHAKAAKLELQSLRQKHLAHRDELNDITKEHPDLTPHVLKKAIEYKETKLSNPSGWQNMLEKKRSFVEEEAATPAKRAKLEPEDPDAPATPGAAGAQTPGAAARSVDATNDAPPQAAKFEDRPLDRRHNKLDSFGASDLELICYRVDTSLNPYVLKSVNIRGQNRANKDRLLKILEFVTGVTPYETFNTAHFDTMGDLVEYLKDSKVALGGERARGMIWPPDFDDPRQGVYDIITLDIAPFWGIMHIFHKTVAVLTKKDLEKFSKENAYVDTNYSDRRAVLRMKRSGSSVLLASLKFSAKWYGHATISAENKELKKEPEDAGQTPPSSPNDPETAAPVGVSDAGAVAAGDAAGDGGADQADFDEGTDVGDDADGTKLPKPAPFVEEEYEPPDE